ncbi:zinc finger protein CONSTANS-like [Impatiens glandulifera]|uniref:zinc finger protein CONSTANS-like n=1 Tax=Impatiens glandulifera TaxID=253017 RepID=UPI001FB04CA2|nr:zinc finger protein CONSTANS-like [Impatiens glandulifera]
MKKKCELCNSTAKVLCESDGAALCWDCDSNIHSSNFLFAKHIRSLLCNTCHSPTPWTGSGSTLSRTLSFCDSCILTAGEENKQHAAGEEQEQEQEQNTEHAQQEQQQEDDDDGDNQVVPIASYSIPIQPPSCSSSNTQDLRRKFRFR